jgi:glycosyltransferase involved in cell wall biosynthesis
MLALHDSPDLPVLLVFSHHRWGDVPERPQQLMCRLAGRWEVVFVEEPRLVDGPALLEVRSLDPALTVLTPHTPVRADGFHDDQLDAVQPLLRAHLAARGLAVDVAWLCTPMALPLAQALAAECLVYDCADGLPALRGDLAQLQQREAALLQLAALVLTAGPSLFDAHCHGHTNIHCVRSAVDAARFSPASLSLHGPQARRGHALQGHLPHPRVGFFGVIDERLDLDLVAALADRQPGWAIILVGPVVGIAAAQLPQRVNIHWLGPQPDELLPYLLAAWDLALMPYAVNESTRFLSPTKTLEYMAGYQPIVSTPIRDVQALYTPAVSIAPPQPEAFARACEDVLTENARARSTRLIEMARFVARHTWDDAADAVHGLLNEALVGVREARLDDELLALQVGVDAGPLQRDTMAAAHG